MAIVKKKNSTASRPAYPAHAPVAAVPVPSATPAQAAASEQQRELDDRADRLREKFAEMQWNLGGLVYEMAARNYFRLEVLREQAALLQQVDSELGETTRLSSIEQASAGGDCPKCGSLFGKGSFFCWNCGFELGSPASTA